MFTGRYRIALVALSLAAKATAQASCTLSGYTWADNSLKQDPCIIATDLGQQCDATFFVPSLPTGYFYSGEDPSSATSCVCNTVYYSLLSICGYCQGGYASVWTTWNVNCSVGVYDSYPNPVPAGTRIPNWATLPLLNNGTIDLASAMADHGAEETSTGSGSKKKTPIGAIVGGVVGGIVALAAIGLLVFFIIRGSKNKKNTGPATVYAGTMGMANPGNISMMSNEKAYDPSDPTTFPSAPLSMMSTPPVSPGPQLSYNGQQPSYAGSPPPEQGYMPANGGYMGAAQLHQNLNVGGGGGWNPNAMMAPPSSTTGSPPPNTATTPSSNMSTPPPNMNQYPQTGNQYAQPGYGPVPPQHHGSAIPQI